MFKFENLITPQEFQDRYPNVFGSLHAIEWFIRKNKTKLIEEGVLIYLQKRKLIDLEQFEIFANKAVNNPKEFNSNYLS